MSWSKLLNSDLLRGVTDFASVFQKLHIYLLVVVTCVARLCRPDSSRYVLSPLCHRVCVAKTHLLGDSHPFPTGGYTLVHDQLLTSFMLDTLFIRVFRQLANSKKTATTTNVWELSSVLLQHASVPGLVFWIIASFFIDPCYHQYSAYELLPPRTNHIDEPFSITQANGPGSSRRGNAWIK